MQESAQPLRAVIARTFALSLTFAALAACGGSGGGSSDNPDDGNPNPADPTDPGDAFNGAQTLTDRLYTLGAQLDKASGNLVVYTVGLNADGTPITRDDFANDVIVKVDGIEDDYIEVTQVTEADGNIAALSFLTDYSASMSDADLAAVADIYSSIVDAMPKVFQASAFAFTTPLNLKPAGHPQPEYVKHTFADTVGDGTALKQAFAFDSSIERKGTPLNDAVTWSLFSAGNVNGSNVQGLNKICSPIRMLFAFADGPDGADGGSSSVWLGEPPENTYVAEPENLYQRLDRHNVVRVMLGVNREDDATGDTAQLKQTLADYAGETGAYVLGDGDAAGLQTQASALAGALGQMTKIVVPAGEGQIVTLEINGKSTTVDVNAFGDERLACEEK